MDASSVLTAVGTLLLLAAAAVGVYTWLAYARWTEAHFRERSERLRIVDVLGALRRSADPLSDRPRRSFVRALAIFGALLVLAVVAFELRETV